MHLKKIHKRGEDGEFVKENGGLVLEGMRLLAMPKELHTMTPRLIEQGQNERWLARDGNKLAVKALNGSVEFEIVRPPGYYCCHCGAALADGAGKDHVAARHKDEKSPDPVNPAGYRKDNFYLLKTVGGGIN